MNYTREDLERQVETYRAKALQEHAEMRRWQNRAALAEQTLADLLAAQETGREEPTT